MHVGIIRIALRAPNSHSLKDRRKVSRSLIQRIRGRFNVSVAQELAADGDAWQSVTLLASCVSSDANHADVALNELVPVHRKEPARRGTARLRRRGNQRRLISGGSPSARTPAGAKPLPGWGPLSNYPVIPSCYPVITPCYLIILSLLYRHSLVLSRHSCESRNPGHEIVNQAPI